MANGTSALSTLLSSATSTGLGLHIFTSGQTQAQVTTLLAEVQTNPASAATVSATLAQMGQTGVSQIVAQIAIPGVASDPTKVAMLIAQAQALFAQTQHTGLLGLL